MCKVEDTLSKRCLKDRRPVDKTNINSKPTTVSMQLISLQTIHSSRDWVRKARESQLIDEAMTLEPNGLNRRDEL